MTRKPQPKPRNGLLTGIAFAVILYVILLSGLATIFGFSGYPENLKKSISILIISCIAFKLLWNKVKNVK